ncbi:MAG: HlyC/CorC family transporter [Lachnospiraceae bacterium]|nr:HlyC/CorC family transporter [Lachnospiraceae bacterium]
MSQGGPGNFRKFFSKKVDEEKVEEEILSMVEEGHENGVIEDNEVELISNIFEFSGKEAKDIMTNRQRILALENTVNVEKALKIATENSYSRYPIYEEDIDNIIGIVHIKDLIAQYLKDPNVDIISMMEKPMYIHPTMDISKLLSKMQKEQTHMAIVVDEYGQTEGVVTMEDIIEEIVGNIFDEHDETEEEEITELTNDITMVAGSAELSELSETLEIEFPDEDFETVNGFLLYEIGRFPEEDENIEIIYQGYKFVPVDIQDKMIKLVRIEKIKEDEDKE